VYKFLLSLILFALPAFAGEFAVLATGFRIHADRHEFAGASVRLYSRDGGFTELPAVLIESFEKEDAVPETAAPSQPVPAPPEPVTPAPAPPAPDPRTLLHDAAVRTGLPPALVESVARVESSLRPAAVSPKGALGLMQLMPATAQALAADPRDPFQNTDAGARLLRELLIKYDGDVIKALSAYNAGEPAVDRNGGAPPYRETRDYVERVLRAYLEAGGK
jgi:soluble lytic murein transglycosylase-like protein